MDTDLLRQQHKWKEIIKDTRDIVKEVEGQVSTEFIFYLMIK